MKKKLLLIAIMVVSLVCVLSFSVSAISVDSEGVADFGTTTLISGMTEKSVFANGTAQRVILKDNVTGVMTTYPAYYIFKNQTGAEYDFEEIVEKTGCSYDATSIVALEIPEGIKSTNATFVSGSFYYVNIPDSISSYNWNAFNTCENLIRIDLAENPSSKTIPSLSGAKSLKYVNIPEGYTGAGTQCFSGCASLESIKFPNSMETLSSTSLAYCTSLTEVVLGANLTYFAYRLFQGSTADKVVYVPSTLFTEKDFDSDQQFGWGSYGTNMTFLYTGNKAQAEALVSKAIAFEQVKGGAGLKPFTQANLISATEYEKAGIKIPSGYTIVYDYNKCEAFYEGVHSASEEIKKSFVGQAFMSDYKVYTECGRQCGAENVIETLDQLIHARGYANCEIPGAKAMMHSFVVDKSLVSKYQEHFADLKFGVLAVGENANAPFNGNLIDAQGNKAHEKIAMVDFTEKNYDELAIKIGGLDGYEDTSLYFCGFVIGGENVYYIENKTVSTQASTITYAQIGAILNPEEE